MAFDPRNLPSMKRTDPRPEAAAPDPEPQRVLPDDAIHREAGVGLEVWLSLVLGVVFMLIGRSFAAWVLSGGALETGVNWTSGPKAGQPVSYFELQGGTAWTDTAIFLFGLALVFEGLSLLAVYRGVGPQGPLLLLAIALTFLAAFLNAAVALYLLTLGITPLMSILAFGFGVYLLVMQWRLFTALRLG